MAALTRKGQIILWIIGSFFSIGNDELAAISWGYEE